MARVPTLYIARTADGNGLPLPSYSSKYHMGLNLQAAIPSTLRLEPGDRAYMPCGFAIGVPVNYCGLVVSQPDLARDQGLIVLDGPQVVHPANRDPLFVLLQNMSAHQVVVHRGDVVAQMVIVPAIQVAWKDVTNGASLVGGVTTEDKVVLESGEKDDHSKMESSRRVHKDIRHRFSKENENESAE